MDNKDSQNTVNHTPDRQKLIEQAAGAWARLCIYHARQKRELQNQNKKEYESSTK